MGPFPGPREPREQVGPQSYLMRSGTTVDTVWWEAVAVCRSQSLMTGVATAGDVA